MPTAHGPADVRLELLHGVIAVNLYDGIESAHICCISSAT